MHLTPWMAVWLTAGSFEFKWLATAAHRRRIVLAVALVVLAAALVPDPVVALAPVLAAALAPRHPALEAALAPTRVPPVRAHVVESLEAGPNLGQIAVTPGLSRAEQG